MNKIPVIIILGPTAIGKSKLGIELAEKIKGEIISADSMQVYKYMDIGTAKPTAEELAKVPHHLININNPDQKWNLSMFHKECHKLIVNIYSKNKIPIIVGGTGLYLWSLIEGLDLPLGAPSQELRKELEKESSAQLHNKLSNLDPKASEKIHKNDKKRIIRALELCINLGQPASSAQKKNKPNNYNFYIVGINDDRDKVYQQINKRIDKMISAGLIDEVKLLLNKGYSEKLTSFQALGYKEVVGYLNGRYSKEEMVEELKKRTRNFARRQLTWFKRFKNINWIESGSSADFIIDKIKALNII